MTEQAEPRWLSPQQTAAWVPLMGVITWLPAALDAQLQRDAGINHVEYAVMSWLSMSPEHTLRMSVIAARANVTLSHLSRIAARLEKRAWVRREPDPKDGRATLAVLTDQGWEKVVATAPGHAAEVQRLVFNGLGTADVHDLQHLAEHVLRAARPDLCLPELPPTAGAGPC